MADDDPGAKQGNQLEHLLDPPDAERRISDTPLQAPVDERGVKMYGNSGIPEPAGDRPKSPFTKGVHIDMADGYLRMKPSRS
jgi:hypothetical protein